MRTDCDSHEKNLHCPMCRAVLLEYFNDIEMPRNPLHIESDIENQNVNRNQETERKRNNSLLYLFLMILILLLLVLITIT